MPAINNIFIVNIFAAISYTSAGILGALLAMEPSNSSPVWPAAGIALGYILIQGIRVVPGLLLGMFCAQAYIGFGAIDMGANDFPLGTTLLKAFASSLQALLGYLLIKHYVGLQDSLIDVSKILCFFFFGAILSCMVSPSICISTFYFQGILTLNESIFAWLTWWVGDVIGVIIFTPIILILFAKPRAAWQSRMLSVTIPLILLLLILVILFFYTKQQEQDRINTLFEHRVERVQNVLKNELAEHKNIAENIKNIFSALDTTVSANEFKTITHGSLRHHPDIVALEWIEPVLERAELAPSVNNTYRFPIKYVEPYLGNESALSYDISLNATALKTLKLAINTGQALSTGLLHIVQDKNPEHAYVAIYAPAYKQKMPKGLSDKTAYLKGVVAVVFNIKNEQTEAISTLLDTQLRMEIKNNNEIFYTNLVQTSNKYSNYQALHTTQSFHAAGNTWQISFQPTEGFLTSQMTWQVWWTLLSGLLLTSFTGIGLLVLTGRTQHITEQVGIKTRDLSLTNTQLQQEISIRQHLEKEQLLRNSTLEALATGQEFKSILAEIVRSAEQLYPGMVCSILLLDKTEAHLTKGAVSSLPDFYNAAVEGLEIGVGVGSCGTAAYTAKRVIVEDIMTHPYWEGFTEIAEKANLKACWSEPIISSKHQVLGTFAIYYREIKSPNDDKLAFIKRMADLTAITLERKMAEEELRIAATTFQTHEAIMITDALGGILKVNRAFTDITGYSAEEVAGQNPRLLSSGEHDETFFTVIFATLREKGCWKGEVWNRRKNGEKFPERLTISAVYDKSEITHYVGVFSDISEQKATEEVAYKLAFYDALTSLPNRRLLLERIQQAVMSAKRHDYYGALLFMDLDQFKLVNDTLGHKIGDELLVQVAKRIQSNLRTEDTVCRLGGDEFVILISEYDSSLSEMVEHAAFIAEKIRHALSQAFELANVQRFISTSIGVSVFPDLTEEPEQILEEADTAMYRSKQLGRNRVSFFSAKMQEEHNKRTNIERMLYDALTHEQFVLHYQGQTNAAGDLLSVEALLRWPHPNQGMINPIDFIPIAEDSHLIIDIGNWVINKACQQIKVWQLENFYIHHVAVNISPRQFRQVDFVQQLQAAISRWGIDPKYLMVELTEGIVIDDINDTIDKMREIKAMGIAISIDDFGTGYSSLAYLKQLPLDQLKIDQSFVRDINKDKSDEIIVEAIIALAHKLNLEVIAEGVETIEQLQFLKAQGCEKFQGFYFCKPMAADSLNSKCGRQENLV
ncbi:MAG: EAL domain-containing protein [Methyloprofundus sp.]|nr:EAL domain-containing protein [Methyloprofundus sp.]